MTPLNSFDNRATSYTVKVKAEKTKSRTYLFGGRSVEAPLQSNLVLVIRVDPEGERVVIVSKRDANANEAKVCELERGEVFAIRLEQLISVAAYGVNDTRVHCSLIADR